MPQEIDQLISRISKLDLNQQRIISELVDELTEDNSAEKRRAHSIGPNVGVHSQPRIPNHNFISEDGIPLAVGDRVEIQTTRTVGKYGDIAEVTKFNKSYIAISVLRNGRNTQRASKYLKFVE